jgi:hypothetical protein
MTAKKLQDDEEYVIVHDEPAGSTCDDEPTHRG